MDGMTLRLAARCQDQNKASSNKSISVTQDPGTGKMAELNVNKLCCHLLLMTIFPCTIPVHGEDQIRDI